MSIPKPMLTQLGPQEEYQLQFELMANIFVKRKYFHISSEILFLLWLEVSNTKW